MNLSSLLTGYQWRASLTRILFYLTTVTSHFPLARSGLQDCDVVWTARLLDLACACEPKENISGTFLKCGECTLIVTAVRLAKPLAPWLTATWNGGERCVTCHHAERYEWRATVVLIALFCISRHSKFWEGPYFCVFQYRALTSKWMKQWDVGNALRFYFEYTRFKSLPDYWPCW